MKKIVSFIFCAMIAVAASAQVTFTVDENLSETQRRIIYSSDGNSLARYWLDESGAKNYSNGIIKSSLGDEQTGLLPDRDVLYKTIVMAYGEHRPLVLSPDVIWLNICQVFGHYVQENAEELRDKLVLHNGEMTLMVEAKEDILSPDADWDVILKEFITQLDENTKDGIVRTLEADFSTTTLTERIASDITLMNAMRPYFHYVVWRIVCGIPSITLTGTPDDWRKVLAKTEALEQYGFDWFVSDMKPILQQFVAASEGNPDKAFWRSIVRKETPEKLARGGCSGETPTKLDGWFTKMFPYRSDGKRVEEHFNTSRMLPSVLMVDFIYRQIGATVVDTDMEMWAGIIGADEDPDTHALTPRIGWFVRKAEGLKKANGDNPFAPDEE